MVAFCKVCKSFGGAKDSGIDAASVTVSNEGRNLWLSKASKRFSGQCHIFAHSKSEVLAACEQVPMVDVQERRSLATRICEACAKSWRAKLHKDFRWQTATVALTAAVALAFFSSNIATCHSPETSQAEMLAVWSTGSSRKSCLIHQLDQNHPTIQYPVAKWTNTVVLFFEIARSLQSLERS